MKGILLSATMLLMTIPMTAQNDYRVPVSEQHEKMQTGKYQPNWESLETHQTPEWFRDAKFGIWAQWVCHSYALIVSLHSFDRLIP